MAKKIISVILLLCMVVSVFAGTFLSADALFGIGEDKKKDVSVTGIVEDIKSVKKPQRTDYLGQANIHIDANKNAGLEGKVTATLPEGTNDGSIYLPSTALEENLFLSWDDESLKVSVDGTEYASGTLPVPAEGNSAKYTFTNGKNTDTLTIKTMKGSTEVSCMFLDLDEAKGTIEDMNADETHETPCYGSVNFEGNTEDYISIKGRGNSTWGFEKRPYNITFYKKKDFDKKKSVELIDGVKAKKWSLLANYLDSSLLRNKIGLDLAKELGIGLDSKFVDLWMNGEYLGNYLLTPKNDYNAPDGGYALEDDNYLSTDPEEPQFKMDGMQEISEISKNKIDGYYNRITVKSIGDDAVDEGVDAAAVEDWFSEAWAAVEDYDSEEYQKYFDIDSWTKMYLMYEVSKTYDAFSGSILMHRDGLTEADKLIAGPAWDMDTSFGRTLYKFLAGITLPTQLDANGWYVDSIGLVANSNPVSLLQELGKHKSFMKRMSEVYNENVEAFNNILPNIDKQQKAIVASANMNNDLWGVNHMGTYFVPVATTLGTGKYKLHYKETSSWNNYVFNLREFVTQRVSFLTDHFYAEAPAGEITAETDDSNTVTLTADITSGNKANTFQWQSSEDGETWKDIKDATSSAYTIPSLNKEYTLFYRCIVKNEGTNIVTMHTAPVKSSAQTILNPVKVTVPALPHKHAFILIYVPATATEEGYYIHRCYCGYEYKDNIIPALGEDGDNTGNTGNTGNTENTGDVAKESVLTDGKLTLVLDGKNAGNYVFAKNENGWTICNADGKYLALSGKNVVLADNAFTWNYQNNMFSATTKLGKLITVKQYIVLSGNKLTTSVLKGSKATFLTVVE